MKEHNKEIQFTGVSISKGISFGKLFFLESLSDALIPELSISSAGVNKEIDRYRHAVFSSRQDLQDLQRFLAKEGSNTALSIIDSHIQMLDDPFITTDMEKRIRNGMKNTETIFHSVISDYESQFSKLKDPLFRQRFLDVKDLSQRILRHLHPRKILSLEDICSQIPQNSVLFTKELIPSSAAAVSGQQVKGFITEVGGGTSHAALIARSKSIPYIANVTVESLSVFKNALVILDGDRGIVIVNPLSETIASYKEQIERNSSQQISPHHNRIINRSQDGVDIELLVNIDTLKDMDKVEFDYFQGVGLFRSEFLLLGQELSNFSEEDQFVIYQKIMGASCDKPVVFRVFDVGGDKGYSCQYEIEPNPALGCRGIRFLLKNMDIFKLQIRALLRVSLDGDLRILLPMISDVTELMTAKRLIQETAEELVKEGYAIADSIPIGCMIEVPSAVIMCDHIMEECDFVSIGTNDLRQYTLAADRTTQESNFCYQPGQISIFRMIKRVVDEGKKQNIPVSVCGEMASDPLLVPLFLGLGVRNISCSFQFVHALRKTIRFSSVNEAKIVSDKVLNLRSHSQVQECLNEAFGSLIDE